jgi:hypothetical protein
LKKPKIKLKFCLKSKEELDRLTHEELLKYVKDLQDNVVQEKPPKNSNNSSIAPSSEIAPPKKKNQSLREKSSRKSGGQKGHKATFLQQTNTPDKTIDIPYNINNCKQCGFDLSKTIAELKEKRQVLDLDLQETNTKITEFQSYSKECPECGYDNHDNSYSALVAPHISYGKNIMAVVTYLSVVHYLSYNRIVKAMKTMYGMTISEGTVDNIIKRASKLSQKEIDKIVSQLEISDNVGIDETGAKVNGSKHWHWVFQNNSCTYIVANKSRGTKVIDENFDKGFINAVVNHDNYSSYNKLIAKEEQLCLAHKLRDLNYAIDCDNTQVMKDIKLILQEAILDHKEDLKQQHREILKEQYLILFDRLLETKAVPKSETQKQINSLKKARDKIFTFLLYANVPPDNNGSERAIRNIKVKQKVSGQFKSLQGAKDYGTLRSIVDTSRKRGMNEFEALRDVIGGESVF